jgi:hypothetical protein
VRITLFASYGGFLGHFEIPPYNGYPDAVFLGDRIFIRPRGADNDQYREGQFVNLREEDRREGTH